MCRFVRGHRPGLNAVVGFVILRGDCKALAAHGKVTGFIAQPIGRRYAGHKSRND